MDDGGAGGNLEQFQTQMRRASVASRARIELFGVGLGVSDEALEVCDARDVSDSQHVGRVAHQRDGGESGSVVGQFVVDHLVDDLGAYRAQQQGVSVRSGLGERLRCNAAAGAGTVLDHHRLLEFFAQFLADQPCDHVGDAAGAEWHEQLDRLGGVGILRKGGLGRGQDGGCANDGSEHGGGLEK